MSAANPAAWSGSPPIGLIGSAAATVLTGLLFGLLPALKSIKGSREVSGFSSVPVQRNLTRRLLVSSEFTLALVLLIGFGLLLRSFLYVESIPVWHPDGSAAHN